MHTCLVMPLVAIALAAYVAGLFSGFADSLVFAAAVVGAAFAVGARHEHVVGCALAGLAVAGCLVARTARTSDARCLTTVMHLESVALLVRDSVGPGSYVRAQIEQCASDTTVWLSVSSGVAPPGTIGARGEIFSTARGILVQHASVTSVASSARGINSINLRAAAGRAIDRTFGGDAPLVRALLIADKTELSPEVRDRFAAAGLAHVLAIAGLHIGILALSMRMALALVGVPTRWCEVATVLTIVVYVAAIGAPVAAVRSSAMLVTLVATRLAQRPTSRWAIVALGAAQPIVAPRVVLQPGYQLTVLGVAAMIAAARLGRRLRVHRLSAVRRFVTATVIGTTVATIGTAPICAWAFGRVSVVAPLSNLAAAPLLALAQPMLVFGLLATPLRSLASFIADAVHPLLFALDFVATRTAAIPYASLSIEPSLVTAMIAGVLSVSFIVACASRDWQTPAIIAVAAAAVLLWFPSVPRGAGLVELHMIDVGQGDAIALRTPHAHWVLFDAGRAWRGGDAGRSTILPYFGREGGGPLDCFVLSHPHTDHVGGAATVLHALRPATYVDGGFPGPAEAYRASLDEARADHVRWLRAHPGDTMSVDGVSIRYLAPDSAWTARLIDPNLASVVALVVYGDVRVLLMGDAERPEEEWLLAHAGPELHADILKVGHHGSSTSSSEPFLAAVAPRLALVSVGAGNSYHLPTPSVMHRLGAHGAQVLRTDRLGTIVVRTDGHRVFIEAAGDEWELGPRSPLPSAGAAGPSNAP